MSRRPRFIFLVGALVVTTPVFAQGTTKTEATTVAPLFRSLAANPQIEALRKALSDPSQLPSIRIDREEVSGSKVVSVSLGGTIFQAMTIPTARLTQLTESLTQKIVGESPAYRSALLELRAHVGPQPTSVIKGIGQFASDVTTQFGLTPTSGAAEAAKVNEAFALALERARVNGISLNTEQLQLLPASNRLRDVAVKQPALAPVAMNYQRTMSALGEVLAVPDPAHQAAYRQSAAATQQAFVDSWPKLRNDPVARSEAVRALDGLAQQSELKAVYGVSSNFSPASYLGIYLQTTRAVALAAQDGQIVCSGLALSDRWIMTAGHCFLGRAWQSMKVVFPDASGNLVEVLPIQQQWPQPAPGSRGDDVIDYAFVRVEPSAAVTAQIAAANTAARQAGQQQPLCLRQSAAGYQEPVIVIGYAANAKLVYDHAYVWFPFRLYNTEFQTVEAMTGARLQRLAEAFFANSPTNQENFVQSNLKSFDAAYATLVGTGAMQQHEYRGRALDVLSERPMFGFDTDTQSGNSGGPVYSRADVCVVGVFGGGRPDNVKITESTWKEHEFATPLSAVLQDLKARDLSGIVDATERANIVALQASLTNLLH
jgi:hypothetical protein